MKIVMFYHSLISDWNHGNAHFLRGVVTELLKKGHQVEVFEPKNGWSYQQLIQEQGIQALKDFIRTFPRLRSRFYEAADDLEKIVKHADLVIVHEWNDKEVVRKIGLLKAQYDFTLLFHDTHHRSVTAPKEMESYDLHHYDGVLAFGEIIRKLYLQKGWTQNAWTWHEAADTNLFQPRDRVKKEGDLVWIGNWGDDERTEELVEFLIKPVRQLNLKATMYGVRYPEKALKLLKEAGIQYGGYLPSYQVPATFARYKFTVHVPRRPYVQFLKGIPTIRPFEALATGTPLITSPWYDTEELFTEGKDYLMAQDGQQMKELMDQLVHNQDQRLQLTKHGLATIEKKHSCKHRVEELLGIYEQIKEAKKQGKKAGLSKK